MAEWSKASDSSSDGVIRVGSNPTADTFVKNYRKWILLWSIRSTIVIENMKLVKMLRVRIELTTLGL